MKYRYLFILPFLLSLQGANTQPLKSFDLSQLSGNVHLTLNHGVWKLWQEKPVYQSITLDLICDRGQCEPEVWGYAQKFNQDVDHQGTLKRNNLNRPKIQAMTSQTSLEAWRLKVLMNIQFQPWKPTTEEAVYEIEIVPHKGKLIGSYQGKFNQRSLRGSVEGKITSPWPVSLSNHRPIAPQEHPRLIFRKHELSRLKETAKTSTGQAIITQLKKTLNQRIYYEGYVPNGGYHATGHCFLALLNDDPVAAEKGWNLVKNSIQNPGRRLLEHAPIVTGIALAYDLCYPLWTEAQTTEVTRWLAGQTAQLVKGDSPQTGWNSNAGSNWNARARGAAGVSALAILHEPAITHQDTYHLMKVAERNVKRFLTTAIGDYGLGSEGDHYTTEPLILTVFPFLQAYRNVMGKDLTMGSPAQWILPHYVMRLVNDNNQLKLAPYGRHRRYVGGPLFSVGLGTVPEKLLPGIIGVFEKNFGQQTQATFGIDDPYQAPFLLAYYARHHDLNSQNPINVFGHVFADEKKGFYNFRNRWQDSKDFVANIYLKRQLIRGTWSFPDVGSFRIWGLGQQWAKAGNSEGKWDQENVVVLPKTQPWKTSKPIVFKSNPDGSGIVSLQTNTTWQKNSKTSTGIANLRSFAVDYSQAAKVPGLFVIADRFIGKTEAEDFKEKVWIMHTDNEVTINQNTFLIQGENGSTMQGTFIAPSQVNLSTEATKTGYKIMARGGNDYFVIMTVQEGKAPTMNVKGSGLDAQVEIGEQIISFDQDRIRLATLNP